MGITHEAKAAKAGRAKIVEVARTSFGLKATADRIRSSLPIGSDEVTVHGARGGLCDLRRTAASAVTPHSRAIEVKHRRPAISIWRWDRRRRPKPRQAIPPNIAADMAGMMSHVVE